MPFMSNVFRYATTIHAINSAIIKLSKLTYAATVYRGMMGSSLPPKFFVPDTDGLAGGIEVTYWELCVTQL